MHRRERGLKMRAADRKSTRLNSSHQIISYAVFCLKKKNKRAEGAVNKPLQIRKTIGSKTSLLPIRTILCCAFQIAVTSIGSKSMKCRLVRASRADGPL